MNVLIIKLGATGDVVRTTPLLHHLRGTVTWVTSAKNRSLLDGLVGLEVQLRVLAWEERDQLAGASFDLAISLEDEPETAALLKTVHYEKLFGAYADDHGVMRYTQDSHRWFDLSLISVYGRQEADKLKLANRISYQEMIFEGLGLRFTGEPYFLPPTSSSPLQGDVAIASEAGAVWPMKKWAHYQQLKEELERHGLKVNFLPPRPTLLEHLADVRGHSCLVNGDSLPMHLALGSKIICVALFTCTSPWEIYEYGLLTKLVSPLLGEFFYKRGFDPRATTAIRLEEVLKATLDSIL